MSESVMEEKTTSEDTASQSTSRMEVAAIRGISPLVTEERATSSVDIVAKSAAGAEIVPTRGEAEEETSGADGNLDHID